MQTVDHRHRSDGRFDGTHALKEGVLGLVCADDGPRRTVVDHLFVGFFGTWRCLRNVAQ